MAMRTDSWEAIVAVLMSLEESCSDYFHQVMWGCRSLSNSKPEVDGLDNLLADSDQDQFDLAVDRERRREKQGYVTPAQARAFLQMSRQIQLESDAMPPPNPVARAYFRALDETTAADARSEFGRLAAGSETPATSEDTVECGSPASRSILLSRGRYPRAAASGIARRIRGARAASRAYPFAHAVRARL